MAAKITQIRINAAALEAGIGAPLTVIGGAEVASGFVNSDSVLILGGVTLLVCGGVNFAFALRNGLEAITRLLRQDCNPIESLERK